MKGNVFSQWLREFCALVFTQTVQAFLLAIILIIVIISISNGSDINNFKNVSAGGILALVALASISKMEILIKKMFGLDSSITDTSMRGGRPGLLGSIAAIKMAKHVLDNAPKMREGISGRIRAKNMEREAKLNMYNSYNRLNSRYDGNNVSSGQNVQAAAAENGNNEDKNKARKVVEEIDVKDTNKDANAENNTTNNTSASSGKKRDNMYYNSIDKISNDYRMKLIEAKKIRDDSNKKIASGLNETAGALVGGTLGLAGGAVFAAGTGDNILDHATKGAGIGIGLGDTAGKKFTNIVFKPGEIKESVSYYKKLAKRYEDNKDKIEQIEKELKKFNASDI